MNDPGSVRAAPKPRWLVLAIGFGTLIGLLAPSLPAAASYGPAAKPASNPSVTVPLSGSVTSSSAAWATVLMGKNDGDFDLFWQLFVWRPATQRWALVTPPGVADNGGLMVGLDSTGTTSLVGFGVSQGLKFSPLAFTDDGAETWSQGGLPEALVAAPSVIGLGAPGSALALVGGGSQKVLTRSGGLTSWKTLVTRSTLSATPAGKTCAIGTLEAVAFSPAGTPLVGASCREPYTPGVFIDSDAQWHLADIPVPNRLADDTFGVLRLEGSSALLSAMHGKSTSIVATWASPGTDPWALSAPLHLGSAGDLLASGTGPGTTQFVVLRAGKTTRADVVAGPGAPWQELRPLPKGTATIAFEPNGQLVALRVDDTKFSSWQLDANGHWVEVQSTRVRIEFGSSS